MDYLSDSCQTKINNLRLVALMYDYLISEKASNLTLHNWVTQSVLEEMKQVWKFMFYQRGSSKDILRIRTGVFFNDIFEKMERIMTEKNKTILNDDQVRPKKVYIYSSFDFMLLFIMMNLKIDNGEVPAPSSSLIFELHANAESNASNWEENSFVKIFYYNETNTENFYELKIPSCQDTDLCTISNFKDSLSDSIMNEKKWKEECKLANETISSSTKTGKL